MKKLITLSLLLIATLTLAGCDSAASILEQNNINVETLPTFTLEELSQYTGADGSTAYIAVEGVVFDVTDAFTNGKHQGIQIGGTDATEIFANSPHSASLLSTLPIVGMVGTTSTTNATTTTNTVATTSSTTTDTPQGTSTELPVFTLDDLAQYTGANGSTAYIAVNGVVYDVTNEFSNGKHQGIQIGGTDATSIFASSPHSAALLSSLEVVGSLEGFDTITVDSQPTTTVNNNYNNYDDDDYDDDYDDDDDDDYDDDYDDDDYDDEDHEDEDHDNEYDD